MLPRKRIFNEEMRVVNLYANDIPLSTQQNDLIDRFRMVRSFRIGNIRDLNDITNKGHFVAFLIIHNLLFIFSFGYLNQIPQVILWFDWLYHKFFSKIFHFLNLSFDFGGNKGTRFLSELISNDLKFGPSVLELQKDALFIEKPVSLHANSSIRLHVVKPHPSAIGNLFVHLLRRLNERNHVSPRFFNFLFYFLYLIFVFLGLKIVYGILRVESGRSFIFLLLLLDSLVVDSVGHFDSETKLEAIKFFSFHIFHFLFHGLSLLLHVFQSLLLILLLLELVEHIFIILLQIALHHFLPQEPDPLHGLLGPQNALPPIGRLMRVKHSGLFQVILSCFLDHYYVHTTNLLRVLVDVVQWHPVERVSLFSHPLAVVSTDHPVHVYFQVHRVLVLQEVVLRVYSMGLVFPEKLVVILVKTEKMVFFAHLNLPVFNLVDKFLVTIESLLIFIYESC